MTTPTPEELIRELRVKALGLQMSLDDLRTEIGRVEAMLRSTPPTRDNGGTPDPHRLESSALLNDILPSEAKGVEPAGESVVTTAPGDKPWPVFQGTSRRKGVSPHAERSAAETELLIGRTWLNRAGAIVLLLGIAFFVKYSIDQGWIGPGLRVIFAACTGLSLLVAGELCLRRGMTGVTAGLMGSGVGILYIAAFGAHNLYHLVDARIAALIYVGVTTLSVAVSVHARQLPVAVIGALGGFGTPIALNTGTNQQIALFSYILLLDLGLLFAAHLRRWDPLRFVAWVGTSVLVFGWFGKHYRVDALWRTWAFFLAFYATFMLTTVWSLHRDGIVLPKVGSILVRLSNAVFFAATYFLWRREAHDWLGLFAAGCGFFQCFCAWKLLPQTGLAAPARRTCWIDAATMFALFMPLQFDRHFVTIGWCLQAVVVFVVCRRLDDRMLRLKGAALFMLAITHLYAFDWQDSALQVHWWSSDYGVITPGTLLVLFTTSALTVSALVLTRKRTANDEDASIAHAAVIVAIGIFLWLAAAQWERFAATWWWMAATVIAWQVAHQMAKVGPAVLILLFACVAKFFLFDTLRSMEHYWSALGNSAFNRAVCTGVLLSVLCVLIRDLGASLVPTLQQGHRTKSMVRGVLAALAAVLLGWTGTFEILRTFQAGATGAPLRDDLLAMHLALSLFWSLHATICLAVGFARRIPAVRYVGLAVFGMTLLKLFLVDLARLNTLYRIGSFVALGGLLLLASLLYQWLSARLAEPLAPNPAAEDIP